MSEKFFYFFLYLSYSMKRFRKMVYLIYNKPEFEVWKKERKENVYVDMTEEEMMETLEKLRRGYE